MKNQPQTFYLSLYNLAINSFSLFLPIFLKQRIKNKKEDAKRINERFGVSNIMRPEGSLIFFHGASVGETLIGLNIADTIRKIDNNVKFLFTSQTLTAANIIESKKADCDIHQFIPFDKKSYCEKFINHWKPNYAIFLEGEIWPNMFLALKSKDVRIALLNARMTTKTIKSWLKFPKSAKMVFGLLDYAQPANEFTKDGLEVLGAKNIGPICNLKFAAQNLQFNNAHFENLEAIKNRNIWLAASTHEGEEEIIFEAQKILSAASHNNLLILAPRHPERADNIADMAIKSGFKIARRSKGELPDASTSIYLWDTLGELLKAYEISKLCIICGSLIPNIGGHNPIEPAMNDCAIISGPYVHNFKDIFVDLENTNGAEIIEPQANIIAMKVSDILLDDGKQKSLKENAKNYIISSQKNSINLIDDIAENIIGKIK